MDSSRMYLALGAASGLISVAAGAFGAHGLKKRLAADLLVTFETAARYQMYHALALCLVGLLGVMNRGASPFATMSRGGDASLKVSGAGFVVGTLLFSGSLYALTLTGVRGLGIITPLGGLAFLVGWAALCAHALRGDVLG